MKKVITGVRLFESSGQGRRGYINNCFPVVNIEWRAWRIPRSGEFGAKLDLSDVVVTSDST